MNANTATVEENTANDAAAKDADSKGTNLRRCIARRDLRVLAWLLLAFALLLLLRMLALDAKANMLRYQRSAHLVLMTRIDTGDDADAFLPTVDVHVRTDGTDCALLLTGQDDGLAATVTFAATPNHGQLARFTVQLVDATCKRVQRVLALRDGACAPVGTSNALCVHLLPPGRQ